MNYYHDWFQFIAQDFSKTDSHMLFPKIACVESGNPKTPDPDEKWSNRSLETSMANWRTQLIQNVEPPENRATSPPSRAGVYCTTACERDAAANCSICGFLSRVLLQGSNFTSNALTQSSSLTSVAYASSVSAACIGSPKRDLTPRITLLRQLPASSNAPELGSFGTWDCNLQMVSHRNRALPAQSMHLVHKYYDRLKRFHHDDGSALWLELEAFITACHEGLLQKFALPGIPDWMAFMSSVTLMLRVLGVLSDEPPSFPISKKFASAFALSTLLSIGIRGEVGQYLISAFVSDHSDQLRSACSYLHDAEGDVTGMSGSASFLFGFLESFIDVAMAKETEIGYPEGRHVFLFGMPWSKSGSEKVHALLCCMINVRDHLFSLGGDADVVNMGSVFLSGVFPCLEQVFPMTATGAASRYTVQSIATLMWLMLYNMFAGAVGREIGLGCFLLIMNVQIKNVRRFLPDLESLNLLTDLLSSLWPTACKVSLCTGQMPPCLWPSTLVALCEWMQQKKSSLWKDSVI